MWGILEIKTANAKSHPSRGAWIEMPRLVSIVKVSNVAPLTGCVD